MILVASLAVGFGFVCVIVLCDEWRTDVMQRFKGWRNRTRIEQILRSQGLCPQRTDDDAVIKIVHNDLMYTVAYENDIFILSMAYLAASDDLDTYQNVAYHTMAQNAFVKIDVNPNTDAHKNGAKALGVVVRVKVLCYNIKEMAKAFPIYWCNLNEALRMFCETIKQQNEQNNEVVARRQYVYNIEYHFLVGMVDAVTDGKLPVAALADEMWLRQNIQKECPPEYVLLWEENFRIERIDNLGDYRLIVYSFPEPVFVPEAVYGAVLVNVKTNHTDYYTLELSYNNRWVLGSMSNSKHANYGNIDSPDLAKFLEWVFSANKHLCAYTDCTDRPANGEMVS